MTELYGIINMQTGIISEKLYAASIEKRSFANRNVNKMVNTSNETISNVLNNYIPHETINCDDRDPHRLITTSKKPYKRKISF